MIAFTPPCLDLDEESAGDVLSDTYGAFAPDFGSAGTGEDNEESLAESPWVCPFGARAFGSVE